MDISKTRFFRRRRDYFRGEQLQSPYVLRFTFHVQYGIILKRLSWVGDRVPRNRDEESPDSTGRDAG